MTTSAADSSPDHDTEDRGPAWRRYLIAVIIFGLLVMWGYALFGPRSEAPGSLDSTAFSVAAEPICAVSVDQIKALPPAHETEDPNDRADVIDEANDHLTAMVSDLREYTPDEERDGAMVTEWLDDWVILIGDRQTFADTIRTDPAARYLETQKAGNHLSEALTRFAEINEMPACSNPGDV